MMKFQISVTVVAIMLLGMGVAQAQQTHLQPHALAVLQGLDKITGRIAEFEVPVGRSSPFGSLRVSIRACHKAPPTEEPESAAFVEVYEQLPNKDPRMAFSGWMYASSPGVSALEHPVYDVWVKDCRNGETSSGELSPRPLPNSANSPDAPSGE